MENYSTVDGKPAVYKPKDWARKNIVKTVRLLWDGGFERRK